jgi:hypothetical protein
MGFPDHPSDQDRQNAPDMHVPAEEPTRDYKQPSGYPGYQGYPQQPGGYPQTPGYPGYGGQQPGGYGMGGYPAGKVNNLSIAALVCGLAQFLLWFLLLIPGFIAAVLAMIFGAVALGQISRRGESGRGMALAGIVLGGLGVLGGVALGILIGVGSAHYHAHMGY